MEEQVKTDIEKNLIELIEVLKTEPVDAAKIGELSNHTIHDASIFQDEDSISIAILIYSFSKIIQRKRFMIDMAKFLDLFEHALAHLEENDPDAYRNIIKTIISTISDMDSKLKLYIEEVINTAQIKKGGKLYEHGISLARAAAVLGISQWELMNYIGKTSLIDVFEKETVSTKDRLKYTRSLFT